MTADAAKTSIKQALDTTLLIVIALALSSLAWSSSRAAVRDAPTKKTKKHADDKVYITDGGKCVHTLKACPTLAASRNIKQRTMCQVCSE